MARRRFYVEVVTGGSAEITGPAAQHLRKVLRVEPGQRYEITDGRQAYLAEVTGFRKGSVSLDVLEELPAELLPVELELRAALVKFDHFEWMIEKATELGVVRIVPVIAVRSEHGLEKAALKRSERWRRIAVEAAQQCRRTTVPEIAGVARHRDAIREEATYRFVLEESEAPPFLDRLPAGRRRSDRVALLVGPEGGWTDEEREAAQAAGWQPVSLGPLILRAETAAIAGLSVVNAAWLAQQAPGKR